MGTRCVLNFCDSKGKLHAKVYRHMDGSPESVCDDLDRFFKAVEQDSVEGMYGLRFDDPSDLAARFVVWTVHDTSKRMMELKQSMAKVIPGFQPGGDKLLDFGGVGIVLEDPGDLAYTHQILCAPADQKTRPKVTSQKGPFR
jgi:hypothetical protein